jgi:dienelactone hydrolase
MTAESARPDDFFAGIGPADRVRHEALDLHLPTGPATGRPAVVFVHGGPVPEGHSARDTAVFRGYGALAAAAGIVGVTFDHPLHAMADYPHSAATLAAVLDEVRTLEEVDPDRIALWCFSGGGALAADLLNDAPPWLRAAAWTYPVLAAPPDWPGDRERFDCVAAARRVPDLPKLLVRVGAEYPQFVATQQALVDTAENLEVIDLPYAVHGFEVHGHDDEARSAVERATAWVARVVGETRAIAANGRTS